jgi:hypothetical protein
MGAAFITVMPMVVVNRNAPAIRVSTKPNNWRVTRRKPDNHFRTAFR